MKYEGPQRRRAGARPHRAVARALSRARRRARARRRHARRRRRSRPRSPPRCPACRSTTGPFTDVDVRRRRPDRDQPGRGQGPAADRRGRRARRRARRRHRALRARAAAGAEGARDHRHQRQDDGDRAHRRAVPRRGPYDASSPATSATRCSTCSRPTTRARAPWPDVFVLELSSFQLETTSSLRPTAAAVLNVTDEPSRPLSRASPTTRPRRRASSRKAACRSLNRDDRAVVRRCAFPAAPSSRSAPACRPAEGEWGLVRFDGTTVARARRRPARARRRRCRWSAATTRSTRSRRWRSCRRSRASTATCSRRSSAFAGLPHRMQRDRRGGRASLYIDDSKATTVVATQAALDGIERPGGPDRRRRRQGPGLPAAQVVGRRRLPRGAADRPRRAAHRARARRHAGPRGDRRHARRGRRRARSRSPSPATPCCCRPRARASTSSRATSSAASVRGARAARASRSSPHA